MDERETAGDQSHLVGLEMADEVPSRVLYVFHLPQGFLDAVLAEGRQAGGERLAAAVGAETLGDGDDGDLVRVAAGAGDPVADGREVLLDGHRTATSAPNLAPSALRRCEGR